MKRFDPIAAGLKGPADGLTPVPVHGVAWNQKWRNWWAGATIASPTTDVSVPAKNAIDSVRRFLAAGDVDGLNQYYQQETDYARHWARTLLGLPEDTPVILDASGTSSILLAVRMFAHVGRHPSFRGIAGGLPSYVRKFFTVTTSEEGSLVPYALKGKDPNAVDNVMFFPATSLFFEPGPVLSYPEGVEIEGKTVNLTTYDNVEVVEQIRKAVEEQSQGGTTCGCIVLPTVSKSGRILPVAEVAALVADLRAHGHNLFFVVDDVQGMGRRDADSMKNPLAYCDAYLYSGSKALGGLLIASACVMNEELVQIFVEKTHGFSNQTPVIDHFQFESRFEAELPEWILKPSAVSIPEITAMNAACMYFYTRGKGGTFQERRLSQLAKVEKERARVVAALSEVPGVKVLQPAPNRPLVPSIVSFEIERSGATPMKVKKALQEGAPIVTPTAPVGHFLRLDIPEYRSCPPVDVLCEKLARVIAQLAKD